MRQIPYSSDFSLTCLWCWPNEFLMFATLSMDHKLHNLVKNRINPNIFHYTSVFGEFNLFCRSLALLAQWADWRFGNANSVQMLLEVVVACSHPEGGHSYFPGQVVGDGFGDEVFPSFTNRGRFPGVHDRLFDARGDDIADAGV